MYCPSAFFLSGSAGGEKKFSFRARVLLRWTEATIGGVGGCRVWGGGGCWSVLERDTRVLRLQLHRSSMCHAGTYGTYSRYSIILVLVSRYVKVRYPSTQVLCFELPSTYLYRYRILTNSIFKNIQFWQDLANKFHSRNSSATCRKCTLQNFRREFRNYIL